MTDDASEVTHTVRFSDAPRDVRLASYGRSFRQPNRGVPLVMVSALPLAIERIAAAIPPAQPMNVVTAWSALLGLGGGVALVAVGAILAVRRPARDRIVTFDRDGIHERDEASNERRELLWTNVKMVDEGARTRTLHLEAPMRTLRLSSAASARIFVLERGSAGAAKVEALLAVYAPAAKRIRSAS